MMSRYDRDYYRRKTATYLQLVMGAPAFHRRRRGCLRLPNEERNRTEAGRQAQARGGAASVPAHSSRTLLVAKGR